MKKVIFCISTVLAALFVFNACNEEDFSTKEYYEYLIYLMSRETRNYQNIYNVSHPYNSGVQTIGYISVGCGGSLSNPTEITVELEVDNTVFEEYNTVSRTNERALLLSEDRYFIPYLTAVFPAHSANQYTKLPVFVMTDGLSPDSMYVIPFSIKSVSGGYKTNPDKNTVLYRIVMDNYYAKQLESTFYATKGYILNATSLEVESTYTKSKVLKPVSQYSIRMLAGFETSKKDETFTLEELKKSAILVTVNQKDNSVLFHPYGTIEVEKIESEGWNFYIEERNNMFDESVTKYFYLKYKYRTVKTPATETAPAVYDDWKYVQEVLRKVE